MRRPLNGWTVREVRYQSRWVYMRQAWLRGLKALRTGRRVWDV